jgi:hypothetical protein
VVGTVKFEARIKELVENFPDDYPAWIEFRPRTSARQREILRIQSSDALNATNFYQRFWYVGGIAIAEPNRVEIFSLEARLGGLCR